MTDAIATAWLLSTPFVLYFALTNKRQLFVPQHGLVQLCLFGILLANVALAICHKMEFRLTVFDVPLMQFGGVALLCFTWVRGMYLAITERKRQVGAGP